MSSHLLPGNATALERHAAQALAQIERVPIPLRDIWNPDTCPVELLPYLAWAFSVDTWSSNWPESAKRQAIRVAYQVHAQKGTITALRRVIAPRGTLERVIEWWQQQPPALPGTFALEVAVTDRGITEQTYVEMEHLIDATKPLSRHLSGLAIIIRALGQAHIGAVQTDGEHLDVYPYQPADITVVAQAHTAGADVAVDELDIMSTAT